VVADPARRPIRLVVSDEALERSRLTVLVRLVLAIPLVVWATLWGLAVFVVAFVNWLAVVVGRRVPEGLHAFVAGYLRYATHVGAYVLLAADPYPWFRGSRPYPVDLEVDPPVEQGRWGAAFRIVLALPALVLSSALGGGLGYGFPGGSWGSAGDGELAYLGATSAGGAAAVAALLAWFAALARGRAPRGVRDLAAFALGYAAQVTGYLLLLTPRYPTADPRLAEPYSGLPQHPVRLVLDDDLAQSRLTVLFRLLLTVPHFVWWTLWGIAATFVVVVAWVVALVTGRVPSSLARFLAAFVRYSTHVSAYLYVLGRRFPGFTGRPGTYEVDVEIDPAGRQSRWQTLFRLVLAIPALLLSSALGGVLLVAAVLLWVAALVTGRAPEGIRRLGASCLRYATQTYAYLLLVTGRYPYAAPVLRDREPEPAAVPGAVAVEDAF
jgi:hypothetical protein